MLRNEFGIDMESHRSKLLSAEDVHQAYLIIPVKRDLGEYIKHQYPQAKEKVKYFTKDVTDPWRQPYPVYLSCAKLVESLLEEVMNDLIPEPEL